jgi:hypothetical protein
MSVTIDFCFNPADSSLSLGALTEQVNRALGCRLEPYEGDDTDFFCRFLGLELTLAHHSLENDRDCDFEAYAFLLDTRTPIPDEDLRCYQLEATALAAFTLLRLGVAANGILTYDVQRLLARYEVRTPREVVDLVSGRTVEYPTHLVDLAGACSAGASPTVRAGAAG